MNCIVGGALFAVEALFPQVLEALYPYSQAIGLRLRWVLYAVYSWLLRVGTYGSGYHNKPVRVFAGALGHVYRISTTNQVGPYVTGACQSL